MGCKRSCGPTPSGRAGRSLVREVMSRVGAQAFCRGFRILFSASLRALSDIPRRPRRAVFLGRVGRSIPLPGDRALGILFSFPTTGNSLLGRSARLCRGSPRVRILFLFRSCLVLFWWGGPWGPGEFVGGAPSGNRWELFAGIASVVGWAASFISRGEDCGE